MTLLVRDYHHTYYVPHNLTLIVTGKLASGTASLLDVVQNKVEPSIVAHGQDKGPRPAGWKRPFIETASSQRKAIPETIKETVEFPEKDESVGELQLGFLGPPPTAFLERKALDILGIYLTSSAVAPLNKEYVEVENPLWYVDSAGNVLVRATERIIIARTSTSARILVLHMLISPSTSDQFLPNTLTLLTRS